VKVKLQADNDLDRTIVRGVVRRQPLVDFQSQPLNAVDDLEVLHLSALESQILVSHDISTMATAFAEYRRRNHSPGVLLVPQFSALADTIDQLLLVWELTEASEWRDRICYLPTLADFVIHRYLVPVRWFSTSPLPRGPSQHLSEARLFRS
jgi:hypothetical protein